MEDAKKTKAQLIEELRALRQRVTALESVDLEHKQRQAAWLENQTRVRQQLAELDHLYNTAPVGLCFMDTALRFVRINEQLAAINGQPVSSHLGASLRDMIPEIAEGVEPVYHRVIASGEAVLNCEVHGIIPAEPTVERDWMVSY